MDRLWGMEVFVRVVECESFSRAAESLDLANATVTSSVRNLEKHLGVTLIQRNTRHLHLTEEGKLFLPKCREILQAVAQAESDVKINAIEIAGPLRIEAPFAIGQSLLCPALVQFTKRHPELSIAVTLTNTPQKLIDRGTDVAIRMDRIEDADLVGRPIYEARHIVCAAPALAAALRESHPEKLDPAQCLGLFEEGNYRPNDWIFTKGDEQVVLRPQGALHFNNTQALIQAATQEAGFIYVLDIFVADLISQGKLIELFPDWNTVVRTFHAVTVKSRFVSPKVRTFIDFLLEIFDERRRPSIKTQVEVGPGRKTKKSH
ncbi:MAG TPA: LysR family transcriptional regulator [Eoetvoesiella sp.]